MTFDKFFTHSEHDEDAPPGYCFFSRVKNFDLEKMSVELAIPRADFKSLSDPEPFFSKVYVTETHLEKMVYYKQQIQERLTNLMSGRGGLTYPNELISKDMTLGTLLGATHIDLDIHELDMTFERQSQQIAVNAMYATLIKVSGSKPKALLIMASVCLELWWRIMQEAEKEGRLS